MAERMAALFRKIAAGRVPAERQAGRGTLQYDDGAI